MTDQATEGSPAQLDDFASDVLDVVDAIPPGQVMSYGDIAEYLGRGGPRQVGRVMSTSGGAVPWWRVVHAPARLCGRKLVPGGHAPGPLARPRSLRSGTAPLQHPTLNRARPPAPNPAPYRAPHRSGPAHRSGLDRTRAVPPRTGPSCRPRAAGPRPSPGRGPGAAKPASTRSRAAPLIESMFG